MSVIPPEKAASVPVPPGVPLPKQRSFLWVFLILIMVMVAIMAIAAINFSQKPSPGFTPTQVLPSPTSIVTDTPTLAFSPTPTVGATASALPTIWTIYQNNYYFPGIGISLIFPYGWTVKYRQEANVLNPPQNYLTGIDFDFLPAAEKIDPTAKDGMGWGGLSISVYERMASISDWITKTFPPDQNKLLPYPDGTIGNFPAYLIAPRKDLDSSDPLNYTFTSRDTIIGDRYIYEFTFSQDGKDDYKNTIKRAIYPFLHFD